MRSRPVIGTVVPHEGGPGYSTTGTTASYIEMYGHLLDRRNLLLVDQRGTGRSDPISCPALQNLTGPYAPAAARCAHLLGPHADDYTSARSADDLAAIIRRLGLGPIDLYGDSYGTFFAQVFAGRHGDLLRSIVLDSAYPTYGESAWYPTQTAAMQYSFDQACRRSRACASGGRAFLPTLNSVLRIVRRSPYRGVSHDGDGNRMHVVVDGRNLVSLAFGATFGPEFYREMTAALRSALAGYRAPLLRLVAQATGGSTDAGPVVDYSEGLDAAVSCHDYPQLYDMAKPPTVRVRQLAASVASRERSNPGTYAPFTIGEYLRSDWEELNWCTQWTTAPASNPAAPPRPPSGHYPAVPVLVLSGEFDSITTPAEGAIVARQFPDARQVLVANSFHVTAVGDTDHCAVRVVRAFVTDPRNGLTPHVLACTRTVAPIRTMGSFPRIAHRRNAPAIAAATVADVVDSWWNNYTGTGFGLRGGRYSYTGDRVTVFKLRSYRFVGNLSVSGTAAWDRYRGTMRVQLTLHGSAATGHLTGMGDQDARRPRASRRLD